MTKMRDFTVPCISKRQVVDLTDPYQALPNTTKRTAGTVVGFKCKTDNYVISSSYSYVTCKPNGEWDKPDPVCSEPTMSSSTLILVLVCSILGAILLLITTTMAVWYFCFRPDDIKRGWWCPRLLKVITDYYHLGENNHSYRTGDDPRQRGMYEIDDDYHGEDLQNHRTFPPKYSSKMFLPPPGSLPRYVNSDDGEPTSPDPFVPNDVYNIGTFPPKYSSKTFYLPPGSLPRYASTDEKEPAVPSADDVIDEYDIRLKVPRLVRASSKPVLEPWSVERDDYHVEHNPIYG